MSEEHPFHDVPIEAVRNFWNARPCNIRHSPKKIGTIEYFDEVEGRKYFIEPHIPGFAEFATWGNRKVLEIGCGIGTDTINFARAGAQVCAVDLSANSVEIARRRAEVFGFQDRIRFVVGDAEHLLDFVPGETYDLVYSFGVIHHSPHPERIVEQLRNYLGAGSELRLMVYSRVSYKLFWIMREVNTWDLNRIDELIAKNSEAQTGSPVTYTYTERTLRRLLEGFKILEMRKAHIFTWDIDAYRQHRYVKDAAWANVSEEEVAELEKELGWHLLVRAVLA